jgi:predicted methyltransferase
MIMNDDIGIISGLSSGLLDDLTVARTDGSMILGCNYAAGTIEAFNNTKAQGSKVVASVHTYIHTPLRPDGLFQVIDHRLID